MAKGKGSTKLKALIMMAAKPTMPMAGKGMPTSKTPMAPTKKTKKKKKPTQAMKSTGSIIANINKKGK